MYTEKGVYEARGYSPPTHAIAEESSENYEKALTRKMGG